MFGDDLAILNDIRRGNLIRLLRFFYCVKCPLNLTKCPKKLWCKLEKVWNTQMSNKRAGVSNKGVRASINPCVNVKIARLQCSPPFYMEDKIFYCTRNFSHTEALYSCEIGNS